ncbi:unnamed protein product [Symbiodinium natans]|uniref:Rhamnosyl O-methyltransferase n=1 Tax=Symbiodinium natans TaxID=878477 RepID=A0A812ME27_9DINO|nr:unnamed protein product [Symbiodinium natans]
MDVKRARLADGERRHEEIASRVENATAGDGEGRFVLWADREDDTDMSVDTLESMYIGQAHSAWRGVPFGKCAFDWQMYAMMIDELRPRTIIDIGSWAGGSALFFADFGQMLVGDAFKKVVSLDVTLNNVRKRARDHPKIEFHECSTERFQELFTDGFAAELPRPWLVSEDAHHHFAAVMHRLHDMLCVGDYVVVEDTSAQMQDWFEANIDEEEQTEERKLTEDGIEQLRKKTTALADFCRLHGAEYRCDTKYTDMFGYNVGKHWNSVLKRVA